MSDHETLVAIARLIVNLYYASEGPMVWYQDDNCRDMVSDLEQFCKGKTSQIN